MYTVSVYILSEEKEIYLSRINLFPPYLSNFMIL